MGLQPLINVSYVYLGGESMSVDLELGKMGAMMGGCRCPYISSQLTLANLSSNSCWINHGLHSGYCFSANFVVEAVLKYYRRIYHHAIRCWSEWTSPDVGTIHAWLRGYIWVRRPKLKGQLF